MYLGLDSSTQSLKALLIDADAGTIMSSVAVNFTEDLPQYNSPNGVLPNEDPLIAHSDPLMWLDALDLVFRKLQETGISLEGIKGISGCGQQHGSVYVNNLFEEKIASLNKELSLAQQVSSALSRNTSPIWMDSSTSNECAYLTKQIGDRLQKDTGSAAIERFTGAQIRKFYCEQEQAYHNTKTIHLVSSFIASVLTGRNCPIDFGDASGMNMLNLHKNEWDSEICEAIAPNLMEKLIPSVPSDSIVGKLSPYFSKYGLPENIPVTAWTGDNPSSLIGMGAQNAGTVVISLGTSDTFFAAMDEYKIDKNGYGHVFGNPSGGYMSLICFKNGSLAREKIKNQYGLDWGYFGREALEITQPGNEDNLLLPYFISEITPLANGKPRYYGSDDFCNGNSPPASYVRAVLETQFQSIKIHSQWIGEKIDKIRVTGGASQSDGICQVLADVFQSPVEKINTTDAAALGGALRAAQSSGNYSWDELSCKFSQSKNVIQPRKQFAETYRVQNEWIKEKLMEL